MDTATPLPAGRADALGYPWPTQLHPATAQAEHAAAKWVLDHGLLVDASEATRHRGVSVGLLAGLTHAAIDAELLELVAQVMAWIFLEDDRYDAAIDDLARPSDVTSRFARYLAVLRHRAACTGDGPTEHALADLAVRLAARGSTRWYERFVASLRRFWLEGVAVESWYRDHCITPDPASYMATRVQTVGVYVCLGLVEIDHELDDADADDPVVRRLAWLTSRIIAYVNDVFSYEKEQRAGDPNNFVHVVRHHDGLDLAGGVALAVRRHDLELEQFLRLERTIDASPAVAHYLAGCRSWMAGALQWQRTVRRYAGGRALLELPNARR